MRSRLFSRGRAVLFTFVLVAALILGSLNVHASTAYTGMRSGLTTLQIVKEMKIGWNLGNTMDTGGSETSWGNPVTTHAMIDKIKQQGFNTLRIPTTWNNHVGGAPNYTIDSAFLNRVEEIANYAFDNNMYVIINAHHENSWVKPTYDNLPAAKAKLAAIWTQVANRFKNYGDYLIFETLNEPRVEGSPEEWSGGTAEGRDCVNQLNLAAVNAIRATGGNNSTRFIMCPTYAAAGYQVTIDAFVVPNNDSRIIVSIHNYSPYEFAMQYPGVSNFTDAHKSSLNSEFDLLYNKFVRNGRGVVIGESGSTNKNNTSARIAHAEYFYNAIISRGMAAIWWDNNQANVGAENFGLFNRSALNWYFPDIANAVIRGAGGTSNTPTPTRVNTPTPTPVRATPTPTTNTAPRSAFSQIEAESYNSQSGVQTESCGEGGQNIGYIENGDYVVYNNIDFGSGATGFEARVASNTSGGNIEIRLDSPSGTLVGTCSVSGTGGWQTWTTRTCTVSGASGAHNLILRFTGGSGYLFNVNWFKFTNQTVTSTPTTTPIPTPSQRATPTPTQRSATPTPTTRSTGGYVVTYVISSDWGSGANADVTIRNNTSTAVNGWTLNWTFPGNQTITNLWNGIYTQSGASVSVKDAGYNATIGANGGTVSFGFGMSYSGTNAKPASFTLNGTACQVQ
ncbi:MAG: cellulase family glycosylhydrolase [Firmicutes bacterium]|nr:cellulase family glycosylhydrolase [Bacillota bacterium]